MRLTVFDEWPFEVNLSPEQGNYSEEHAAGEALAVFLYKKTPSGTWDGLLGMVQRITEAERDCERT